MTENVFSLKHTLVDTEGNLMEVKVTGADDSDLAGGKKLLEANTIQIRRMTLWMGLRGRGER